MNTKTPVLRRAFLIYLSIYFSYYFLFFLSYISSFYNRLRIVRRGWALFVIEGRDKPMSVYEIIMLLLQVITVVIAFGALIALVCFTKDK